MIFWFLRLKYATFYVAATPEKLLAGVAHVPFQYRVLVPILVRLIDVALSIDHPRSTFAWVDLSAAVGTFCFFVCLIKMVRAPVWAYGCFIWIMLANYVYLSPVNYIEPYDMPAVLTFMAGIWALHGRRYGLFYGLLIIGMINRETAALLSCAFVFNEYDRMVPARLARHIVAQMLIIFGIKTVLFLIYRHNDGIAAELYVRMPQYADPVSHIAENIEFLVSGMLLPLFGGLWVVLAGTVWFIEDRFVRRLMWLIPIEFSMMMLLGHMVEFRLFNECVPVVALGAAAGLAGLFGRRGQTPRELAVT